MFVACVYICVCVFVLAGNTASSKLPKAPRIGSVSVVADLLSVEDRYEHED